MTTTFKLEVFCGDGTDKVHNFLKKFDRYINIANIKAEQQAGILYFHLDRRARWFIDNLNPAPADFGGYSPSIIEEICVKRIKSKVKTSVFQMQKMPCENINDFLYRLEKDAHTMTLPDNVSRSA